MARAFPRAAIVSAYGQTEMSGATTLLKGPDSTRKMGSVGEPMLGVELRVVDDALRDVPVGEVGEIVYRGPNVMAGYHQQPEATEEAFAGDWFHSGDLARFDDERYLWLVDRKKDMIVSGGENVYPAEVERVLLDHPSVAEAAVIGVPHPRWVETPVAFVVPSGQGDTDEAALIAHCREYLAGYKKPSVIVVVDELPRNAGGKVLKRILRETYSDQLRAVRK
jgi:acyl-CoA synthetase (AMP-forming)/AMP-acid ligase II